MKINSKFLFLVLFIIILSGVILNYFVKVPNDGVVYLAGADYLINNKILIDPTRTFENFVRQFPTTQIGIVLYVYLLKVIFQDIWFIAYCICFATLWTFLINKLFIFSKKNFSNNSLYLLFPILLFLNYDYIVSASSFYNETLYFPFLIYAFIKIINSVQKRKNIFQKSFLFCIFLAFGTVLRIQHIVFLAAIGFYFLITKQIKNFIYTSFFAAFNILTYVITLRYLQSFDTTSIALYLDGSYVFYESKNVFSFFLDPIKDQLLQFDLKLVFKNLKVHLSLYTHFLNISKIMDFALRNNFTTLDEILYAFLSFSIFFTIFRNLKKANLNEEKKFLIIYFIFTSLFLFLVTDYSTRYFLLVNFPVLFFLFDYLNKYKIIVSFKKLILPIFLYLSVLGVYGYGYFNDKNLSKNTFTLVRILKDFNNHRQGYYDSNDLFISKYRYNIYWILKRPSVNSFIFFKSDLSENFINDDRRYLFIGDKSDLNNNNKIIKIEDYSFSKYKKKNFSIWRIYLNK